MNVYFNTTCRKHYTRTGRFNFYLNIKQAILFSLSKPHSNMCLEPISIEHREQRSK